MATMTLVEVERALCRTLGAPLIKYDAVLDRFTLMSLFFKALGRIGSASLIDSVKAALPGAQILKTWTNDSGHDSHCGFDCVEFRI